MSESENKNELDPVLDEVVVEDVGDDEDDEDELGEPIEIPDDIDELFPDLEEEVDPAEAAAAAAALDACELSSRECAVIAARAADSKKASDIMVQEVRELIGVTDYFVIVTAANNRQVNAIIDEIEEKLRVQARIKPFHREGTQDGTWALLDYGTIVVHVFQPETREYYRLEALWNDAPVVDLAAEGLTDIPYSSRIAKLLGKA